LAKCDPTGDIPEIVMEVSPAHTKIYSVTELNTEIKTILEQQFPFVWISGEISNFSIPASGHFYFSLKDRSAQISAVMFRGQNRRLKFDLENGMSITGLGRISVYEPRGTYQIIFEHIEPKGVGALQLAFEQLKNRLDSEGLFDDRLKKPLPFLPEKIHVITSPTGAVVHDIIHVAGRRFAGIGIDVIPVMVQGEGAAESIANGITLANSCDDAEVIILARGGGSLEDLQAFNSEIVARAIHATAVPIVSAVGHETDYTIADFVADLRAPTPSAAAEIVIPSKDALLQKIEEYKSLNYHLLNHYIDQFKTKLDTFSKRLVDPRNKMDDYRLAIDEKTERLQRGMTQLLLHSRERLDWKIEALYYNSPDGYIAKLKEKLNNQLMLLKQFFKICTTDKHHVFREALGRLNALNPADILTRGYSITRTIPEANIVTSSRTVDIGQHLEVLLANGSLTCSVKERKDHAQKDV
jgi:exodeoxyribonuclease VII large subunit